MRVVITTVMVLATVAVTLSAPAPGQYDRDHASSGSQHQRRARQSGLPGPGLDILGQVSEAFQEHVQQKHERIMDVADQVGKVLGGIGDTVKQAIGDHISVGEDGGGQRSTSSAANGLPGGEEVGQRLGHVLSSIGDALRQVGQAPEGTSGNPQRSAGASSVPVGDAQADGAGGQTMGQIFASLGNKLRHVATAETDEEGQRATGELGQHVGQVLTSIGDTIRQVIHDRQQGEDDVDEGVRGLIGIHQEVDNRDLKPAMESVDGCNNMGNGMGNGMGSGMVPGMGGRRGGRRG